MDSPSGRPQAAVQPGVTSEWDFASLLIGCTTLLLLPLLVLVLFQIVGQHGNPIWTAQQLLTLANFGLLATLIPMGMVLAGLLFAILGLIQAHRPGRSPALAWAGLVLCLLAVCGTAAVVLLAMEVQTGIQGGFSDQLRKTSPAPQRNEGGR